MSKYLQQKSASDSSVKPTGSKDTSQEKLAAAAEHFSAGRLTEAEAACRQMLAEDADNMAACFNLGVILQRRGQRRQAIGYYRRVLDGMGNHFHVLCCLANACQDENMLDEAADAYRQALVLEPDQAQGHLGLGTVFAMQDKIAEAASCFEQALALDSGLQQAHYNLGLIRFRQGQNEAAVLCYERALLEVADDVDTLFNLGLVLRKLGRTAEAARRFRQALVLSPRDAELHTLLGAACKAQDQLAEATECFRQALLCDPDYGPAWSSLGVISQIMGRTDEAVSCFGRALELGHDPDGARYMLAALTGGKQEAAPRQYVADLFDSYAATFDRSLIGKLGYRVPWLLQEAMLRCRPHRQRYAGVLDLGCGTGLAGAVFRQQADSLVGVDLSEAMLEQARAKGIYDRLESGELVEYLEKGDGSYDLVIAADVLIYLGELRPVFRAVARRMKPDALFVFSLEQADGAGEYLLRPSGRYAHTRRYIEELAALSGLTVLEYEPTELRQEKGEMIPGNIVILASNPARG